MTAIAHVFRYVFGQLEPQNSNSTNQHHFSCISANLPTQNPKSDDRLKLICLGHGVAFEPPPPRKRHIILEIFDSDPPFSLTTQDFSASPAKQDASVIERYTNLARIQNGPI